ncbi:hypothetical protein DYB32_007374 [Aphanomyces invadans]|uniref:Coatomer subunit delta n=1 Tax=Aphanomyces invadans TaxID=157072 RepID=A0A418AYD5_9STRA|nr:hypothetical protein DYB32_007374 [Aphanomyces invadans]
MLLASETRQHTFIDTESVRYVYQPIESFFLLLITNKTSNIVEDLHTMQLMAKLVPDICGPLTEAHIREKQFDLVFGFDELLTAGGHAEQINLQQIRTNLEMESHEEKLHLMIQKTKLENATADRKRQEARIKEEQREKARQERAAGITSKASGYTGFGSGFASPTASSYSSQSSFGSSAPKEYTPEPVKSSSSLATSKASSGRHGPCEALFKPSCVGMKLGGGSKKGSSFLDAMAAEDDLKDIPPVVSAAASIAAPSETKLPEVAVSSDPVSLAIEEKVSVQLNRDGAVEQLEVKGSLFVAGNDPESSACRLHLQHSTANGTHPKVDKKLFEAQSILALKDDTKPFPASRVAVLRWAIKTQDESFLPLNITCWPEEEANGKMTVSLEYSMDRDMVLENVVIQVPTGVVDPPHISQIDGEYRHNPTDNVVLWRIPSISSSNSTGSLEFTIRGQNLDAYFPIQVSFYSRTTYCDLAVQHVLKTADQSPVQYGFDQLLSTESYVVQ